MPANNAGVHDHALSPQESQHLSGQVPLLHGYILSSSAWPQHWQTDAAEGAWQAEAAAYAWQAVLQEEAGLQAWQAQSNEPKAPHLLLRPPQLVQRLLLLLQHLDLAAQPLGLQTSDEKALRDLVAFYLHAHKGRHEFGQICLRFLYVTMSSFGQHPGWKFYLQDERASTSRMLQIPPGLEAEV